MLPMLSDWLNTDLIQIADRLRATAFVRYVEVHDTLASTNDRAANLARDPDIELPALIVARHQTAGRGRGRKVWWSADGGLTFSLLIDPITTAVVPANWPQVSLATAVAVCDALAREMEDCRFAQQQAGSFSYPGSVRDRSADAAENRRRSQIGVKWPNDVLLDGGKICGILLESPGGAAPGKDRLIIGIGVNINNSWQSAPRAVGDNGVALCDSTGVRHDLAAVLLNILSALDARICQLRNNDPALLHAWQSLNLLSGQIVCVETNERRVTGECVEIARDGALVINTPSGRQRHYSGSVRVAP